MGLGEGTEPKGRVDAVRVLRREEPGVDRKVWVVERTTQHRAPQPVTSMPLVHPDVAEIGEADAVRNHTEVSHLLATEVSAQD